MMHDSFANSHPRQQCRPLMQVIGHHGNARRDDASHVMGVCIHDVERYRGPEIHHHHGRSKMPGRGNRIGETVRSD